MNLNLGIPIYSIPGRSIDTLIDFAEKNHFDAIELWDSPLPDTNERLSRYLNMDNRELSVHAPLFSLGDEDSIVGNTLALRNSLERAGRWGAKKIVLHAGTIRNGRVAEGFESARRVINSNLDLLQKYGIMLCIENETYLGRNLIRDFEKLREFVDSFLKHLVGIVFDVSHANITGGVAFGIEVLGDRIKHVHLSDNYGESENHHKPIGKGNIDFGALENCPLHDISVAILEIAPDDAWQKNLLDGRKVLQELKLVE